MSHSRHFSVENQPGSCPVRASITVSLPTIERAPAKEATPTTTNKNSIRIILQP